MSESDAAEQKVDEPEPTGENNAMSEPDGYLTINNCADLKALMEETDHSEEALKVFADEYEGREIEFDGNIAFIEDGSAVLQYGDYIDEDHRVSGPLMTTREGPDSVPLVDLSGFKAGDNVRVVVKIKPYVSGSYMYRVRLESIEKR